jgi:hypothetical protein
MPKLSEMLPSRFLKKDDVPSPMLVTVGDIEQVNVAPDGQPPENKWTMTFPELDKPLVLNSTNMHIIGAIYGDDTDGWLGQKIVIYSDPNVSFGGKLVGGLRLRAPKNQKSAPTPPAARKPAGNDGGKFDDLEDDVPF